MFSLLGHSTVHEESKHLSLPSPVCSISSAHPWPCRLYLSIAHSSNFRPIVDNIWLSSTPYLYLIFNLFLKPFCKCYALSPLSLNLTSSTPSSHLLTPLFHPTNHLSTRPTCVLASASFFSLSLTACLCAFSLGVSLKALYLMRLRRGD